MNLDDFDLTTRVATINKQPRLGKQSNSPEAFILKSAFNFFFQIYFLACVTTCINLFMTAVGHLTVDV